MKKKLTLILLLTSSFLFMVTHSELSDDTATPASFTSKRRGSIFNAIQPATDTILQEPEATAEPIAPPSPAVIKQDESLIPQPAQDQVDQEIDRFVAEAIAENVPEEKSAKPVQANDEDEVQKAQKTSVLEAAQNSKESEIAKPAQEADVQTPKDASFEPDITTLDDQEEYIEFYFENADILNLLQQISEIFDNITFITDEIIDPLGPAGKALKGNKISFKTHKPLSKKAAWNLFLTFLDLAGFALVPEPETGFYRVVTFDAAQRSPVPTFIGVDPTTLPDNDQIIRYVYFIQNARIDAIKDMIEALRSQNARTTILPDFKAFVITDKAYNIKTLMQVIKELDKVSIPEAMSVVKLVNADAKDVKKLYDSLTATTEDQAGARFGARKQPTSIYFPENARIIVEPRTNSLILLGPADALKKIEDFIIKHVDVDLDQPYSPFQVQQLRYAKAETVAEIMNNLTQFGKATDAGKTGGVRGGDKYLKPMSFTPDPTTNSLIIKGDYEDYLKALEIIKKLDEPQPQIAIEALILTVDLENAKEMGTQLRNKVPGVNGLLGNNVSFQTSGLTLGGRAQGIVTRPPAGSTTPEAPGSQRLLGNLINLVQNAVAGNTVVSLGADVFGVWGIFNIFQKLTNAHVVSNPFLVATNKTPAEIAVGEIRRVVTSEVFAGTEPQNALGDFSAQLKLEVTPQINSDGMILLKLHLLLEDFISTLSNNNEVAKQTRDIETYAIVADREVIALGGLIQDRIVEQVTKVPILGDIPVFGWLFKNKQKNVQRKNLFVLISSRIIEPEVVESVGKYTQEKLNDYYDSINNFTDWTEKRDPIYRRFFENPQESTSRVVEDFIYDAKSQGASAIGKLEQATPGRQSNVIRPGKFALPKTHQGASSAEKLTKFLHPQETGAGATQSKRSRSRDARRRKSGTTQTKGAA